MLRASPDAVLKGHSKAHDTVYIQGLRVYSKARDAVFGVQSRFYSGGLSHMLRAAKIWSDGPLSCATPSRVLSWGMHSASSETEVLEALSPKP